VSVAAVASVRSCGCSTLALGLVATWPPGERRAVLVEADPAGGTLAAAAGWAAEPGLVSLAATARHGGDPALVFEHCQALPGGVLAVAGPASADQSRSALRVLGPLLGHLGELDAEVVVDCGRIDPGSTALSVVERADRVLVAVRPRLADLHATATWLAAHPPGQRRVSLVAVGDGPYPDAEIADALGVEVAGRLPWDPEAADALASVPVSARALRAAPLVRSLRSLAERLAAELDADLDAASAVEPASALEGGRVGLRRRVLAPWRAEPAAVGVNGSRREGATP
jgi:MinD-like ATPase involved in chromosome partitioning or flagellar assembly